jgi:hypothetical protein
MERGSKLDKSLQEYFVRARGGEPELFPHFMSAEKFSGIEEGDTPAKFFGFG